MAKLEGIQACVFDAYGTLFDVHAPVRARAGELGEKAEPLSRLWRQKQLEYTWLRSLMGVHADFWHVTGDALDYALASLEIDEQGLKDELMVAYLKLEPFADSKACLEAARAKGLRTAILSNGSPSMLDAAVRHSSFDKLFDAVLSVEDVGIYKPSRRVYRLAMQHFKIQDAASICFVSANAWDVQAAAQFGFQSVKIARTPSIDDRIPGKPAAEIASLSALADFI
jgi:2-haloacid dehalogenase